MGKRKGNKGKGNTKQSIDGSAPNASNNIGASKCEEVALGIHKAIENDAVTNRDDLVSKRKEKIKGEENLEMKFKKIIQAIA